MSGTINPPQPLFFVDFQWTGAQYVDSAAVWLFEHQHQTQGRKGDG